MVGSGFAGVNARAAAGLAAQAERSRLNLSVDHADAGPNFRFMILAWDGKIRMDPSAPYAMRSLVGLKNKFDVAFACDTDHDRHGIVNRSAGLRPPNHRLSVWIHYLFTTCSG